jgi:hypothetical protein
MDKKTGLIVSIVGSVVALCLALGCCSGSIWGGGNFAADSGVPGWLFIILGICLGLIPIIGAVLLWVFLVIRAKDEGAAEVMPQMDV